MVIVNDIEKYRDWIRGLQLILIGISGLAFYFWMLKKKIQKYAAQWNLEKVRGPWSRRPIRRVLDGYSKETSGKMGRRTKGWCALALNKGFKIIQWHENRLLKSGVKREQAGGYAWKWCLFVTVIPSGVLLRDVGHPSKALLLGLGLWLYFGIMTQIKIQERKDTFVTGVYKIYRHMALQLTSGMSSPEVVKYLHESVDELFLKEALFGFSSCYFKTMDLDLAAEELTRRIEGDEIQVLATVLRQGLQTGDPYEMIVKQEQLMVKRYYAALASESEKIRVRGILIAMALCLLVFLLLAVPMVYEMGRATQTIFLEH